MSKASRRERKLRDIQLDAQGNAVYTGAMFRIAGDDRAARIGLGAGAAALALAVVGSGCIDAAGTTNTFYVILPFLGEVCALFAMCWQAVKIVAGRGGVRDYVHEAAAGIIPGACRVLTVFALFGLLAAGYYLIRAGAAPDVKAVAYLVLKVLTAAGAERYGRAYKGLEWTELH